MSLRGFGIAALAAMIFACASVAQAAQMYYLQGLGGRGKVEVFNVQWSGTAASRTHSVSMIVLLPTTKASRKLMMKAFQAGTRRNMLLTEYGQGGHAQWKLKDAMVKSYAQGQGPNPQQPAARITIDFGSVSQRLGGG